jgi:ABC-2 type transport system permease protein
MSTLALTYTDSATMLRRNLRRLLRYPSLTLLLVGMPIVFLLLFVYLFGGQLSAGLAIGSPAAKPDAPLTSTTSRPESCS